MHIFIVLLSIVPLSGSQIAQPLLMLPGMSTVWYEKIFRYLNGYISANMPDIWTCNQQFNGGIGMGCQANKNSMSGNHP